MNPTHPTITLSLIDGVRVVVPDSLDLLTPYVLREQQDWFEDEIKFLRRLLKPGQKVIDIGASYGVYTLSMGQTVGPSGFVWAFEPASSTADMLAASIAANGFAHVILDRSAVSSVSGSAQLSRLRDSELNALVRQQASTGVSETVPLTTLDERLESYRWQDIEFLKIDAEGEEGNILKGGTRFFAEQSPLVMYEIKAGNDLHFDLVQAFALLGYDSYRLVPGLNLLVPFDAESPPDEYLLNLFSCKPARAARLAAEGFLVQSLPPAPSTSTGPNGGVGERMTSDNPFHWQNTLVKLPYGTRLSSLWNRTVAAGRSEEVEKALSRYSLSGDSTMPAETRFSALENSFKIFKSLCSSQPSYLRLASLARTAQAYGARSLAVKTLIRLCDAIFEHKRVDPSEPFLPPSVRFDAIDPGDNLGNWLLAAALEELERVGSYSSFYSGASAMQRLSMIRDLGFCGDEMQRRLSLVEQRARLTLQTRD